MVLGTNIRARVVIQQPDLHDVLPLNCRTVASQSADDVLGFAFVRFRPNIVVHGAGPFAEDMWEEIVIASPSSDKLTLDSVPGITLVCKCARCLVRLSFEYVWE